MNFAEETNKLKNIYMDGHEEASDDSNNIGKDWEYAEEEGGEIIKKKRERRSKDETDDRNYICGCGKSYLSYAALYTHAKTKH